MRAPAWIVVLACGRAMADEGEPSITVRAPRRWQAPQGPLLHLDHVPPLNVEGLGAMREREAVVLELGDHIRMAGEGEWWQSTLSPQPLGPTDFDDVARGWRAGYRLSVDLGPFLVAGTVAMGHVDSRFGSGTYHTQGVAIYRRVRLTRWMRAWISLGVSQRTWVGDTPPPGEEDDITIGLTIGTTFR